MRSVAAAIELGDARGLTMVPGIEVTCRWSERQWHILVYGIRPDRSDPEAAPFLRLMDEIDLQLQHNAEDARQRIETSGRPLPSLEEVRAGRPLWPFHVLSTAIRERHVPNLKEAADLVTELGGTFTADLPLEDVVQTAHRAGGICVVAHPGRADAVGVVTESDLDRILDTIPLDGLEAHYRSYSDAQTDHYRRLAMDRRLLISCGSDSHAPNMPVNPRPWHAAWCAELLHRLGIEVEGLPDGEPAWLPGMDPAATAPSPEPVAGQNQTEPPGEQILDAERELEVAACTGS
jgi:3',5'-nucleoside bisphosphate phosphatase